MFYRIKITILRKILHIIIINYHFYQQLLQVLVEAVFTYGTGPFYRCVSWLKKDKEFF